MATTYLEALNRVLQLIGEEQVDEILETDSYTNLLSAFLNDIKEQIEDSHNWRALKKTYNVTVLPNSQTATITGANERSRLVRIYQSNRYSEIPLVFDVTDSVNPDPLIEIDLAELFYKTSIDPDTRQDPVYFAIDNSAGGEVNLKVWPIPSSQKTIQVTMVTPQERLTNANTQIYIPTRPLVVGTAWYALEERGEELGVNALFSETRFKNALDDAISRDAAEQGNNMELVSV
jgi:hypothetical protein